MLVGKRLKVIIRTTKLYHNIITVPCSYYVLNTTKYCWDINFNFQRRSFDLVMVRYYKRKTQKGQHDGTLMLKAIGAVRNGLSIRAVARDLRLNRVTLNRKFKQHQGKSLKTLTGEDLKSKRNHRQIFTPEEETLLRKYLLSVHNLFNGLTYGHIQTLVYDFGNKWNKHLPTSWKKYRMGGIDFVRSFVKKYQDFIPLKPSELTTMNRAHSFNKTTVDDPIIGENISAPLKYYFEKEVVDWRFRNKNKIFSYNDLSACLAASYHNICTQQDKIEYVYT